MGCLDPQLNKERTFELLRKRGAVRAELYFYGGHDEGNVESITLTLEDGSTEDFEVWYCGGYRSNGAGLGYTPISEAENEDQELSDLLQGPVDAQFGSWDGVDSTSGTLVWAIAEDGSESCRMNYSQDEPVEHEHVVF